MADQATVTFQYDPREDRLFLLLGPAEPPRVVSMTRRMTHRLAATLAGALERVNRPAQRAPADLRDEVVRMTHQGAVAQAVRSESPWTVDAAARTGVAAALVTRVDVHVRGDGFTLELFSEEGGLASISSSAAEMHQILQVLLSFAEQADWNLGVAVPWLTERRPGAPGQPAGLPQ